MTKPLLVLLMPLVLLCVSLGESNQMRCCTSFSLKPLPLNRLKQFSVQDATTVCRLHAVILTTVKGKKICADPDLTWVKQAVNYISKYSVILIYNSSPSQRQ
ncbi:C-C motif chemokine 20 [Clarias gariepinus]|uniref:C-C motif chemokine 20 n=1 Tax=Clarias gariepinus TaxID=13013 RepID=UPI00234DDB76|nr:C-C motif chemokine 20 [Clarias gariepinus]